MFVVRVARLFEMKRALLDGRSKEAKQAHRDALELIATKRMSQEFHRFLHTSVKQTFKDLSPSFAPGRPRRSNYPGPHRPAPEESHMTRSGSRFASLLALCLTLALIVGCGAQYGTIQGKITQGGTPLAEGNVVFVHKDTGFAAFISRVQDGAFATPTSKTRLMAADYRLFVTPPIKEGEEMQMMDLVISKKVVPEEWKQSSIPEKYMSPETSGWTVTLAPGDNPPLSLEIP